MDGKPPSSHQEFFGIIEALNSAGCNLLQKRPGEAKPLPKLWLNPLSGEALGPPSTPDERAILAKHDPELMALLDELKERPYAVTQRLRDDEAQRQSLMSVVYDEAAHRLNPYRGDNETAKGELMRRDPLLGQFFEQEARDVEMPIFGKNKNLTVAGKLAKDPSVAGLVQLAERIHEGWRQQDKLAAQQQRAAAEETLKRLEGAAA
jgi:hypothetical protein